jgi:hypothetical protein
MKVQFYIKENGVQYKIYTTKDSLFDSLRIAEFKETEEKKSIYSKLAKLLYENNELADFDKFEVERLKVLNK